MGLFSNHSNLKKQCEHLSKELKETQKLRDIESDQNRDLLDTMLHLQRKVNITKQVHQAYNDSIQSQLNPLLEKLTDKNATYLYEKLSPIDYDNHCLWESCYELLQVNPSDYFYAEDAMGYFEVASYQRLVEWAEIAKFHDIDYKFKGCYESFDSSKLDENLKEEYDTYKKSLHICTIQKIIQQFPEIHDKYISTITKEPEYMDFEDKEVQHYDFYGHVKKICTKLPSIIENADIITRYYPPVTANGEPRYSIWGEVTGRQKHGDQVYEVFTNGQNGIMIPESYAKEVLSARALNDSTSAHGFVHFEDKYTPIVYYELSSVKGALYYPYEPDELKEIVETNSQLSYFNCPELQEQSCNIDDEEQEL